MFRRTPPGFAPVPAKQEDNMAMSAEDRAWFEGKLEKLESKFDDRMDKLEDALSDQKDKAATERQAISERVLVIETERKAERRKANIGLGAGGAGAGGAIVLGIIELLRLLG